MKTLIFLALLFSSLIVQADECMLLLSKGMLSRPASESMLGYTEGMIAMEACRKGGDIAELSKSLDRPSRPIAVQPVRIIQPQPAGLVCQVYNGARICTLY